MFLIATLGSIAISALLTAALNLAYLETAADFPLMPKYRRHSALRH